MTGKTTGSEPKVSKGERTRALILEAALELFREHGFEDTTMRAIADRAGVSLGNAYYYFKSKEHLIQAIYAHTHDEHRAASAEVLARETDLAARLLGVMRAKVETLRPYHRFGGVLFRTAGDPHSPLNPFSPESREVRAESTALFAEVLAGADVKLPKILADELPELLWLYHMGVILFWIHDDSPGLVRTERLVERTVELVARLIGLARLPVLRPLVRSVLRLVKELRDGVPYSS